MNRKIKIKEGETYKTIMGNIMLNHHNLITTLSNYIKRQETAIVGIAYKFIIQCLVISATEKEAAKEFT